MVERLMAELALTGAVREKIKRTAIAGPTDPSADRQPSRGLCVDSSLATLAQQRELDSPVFHSLVDRNF